MLPLFLYRKSMIHRTAARSKIQHRCQCLGNIAFCRLDRSFQISALRKIGCDRRRKRTSGSVRVWIVDPHSMETTPASYPSARADRWHLFSDDRPLKELSIHTVFRSLLLLFPYPALSRSPYPPALPASGMFGVTPLPAGTAFLLTSRWPPH